MPTTYRPLIILLHWTMALAFLLMLMSGLAMANLDIDKSLKFQLFQWHKSLGVLLLIAFFLRLGVRVSSVAPPFPDTIPSLEKKAAKAGHWVLYLWMFALPMTGWLMVSASPTGLPTMVFGWFQWPHVPGIVPGKELRDFFNDTHTALAYIFIALIMGHVIAVIRHAWRGENLLPRMGIGT